MRTRVVTGRDRRRALRSTRNRFRLELLEPRELLTVYKVTNASDTDSPGSLRYVIGEVNGDSSPDVIDFDIPGTGLQTINLSSPLPQITNSVTIDGTTQNGTTGPPQVAINGASLGTSNAVVSVSAGSSTIEDLAIVGCPGAGIVLSGGADDLIEGCYIGTANGTQPTANGDGIQTIGVTGATIGGTSTGAGNVIAGNTGDGIELAASGNTHSSDVLVEGNIIGLVASGSSALGNGGNGIFQNGSDGTTIGGTTASARNIISGNTGDGISLGTGIDSLVEGNYLGTDITGMVALANGIGINFTNASYATIGGTVAGAGNLISGNTGSGIDCFVLGSMDELIEGNLVGVDVTGRHALGNGNQGVRIAGPTGCTIGGTIAAAANIIADSGSDGINTLVGPSTGMLVLGNYIGTDPEGDDLGNKGNGVDIGDNGDTIGGTTAGAGNVIANNGGAGITIGGSLDDNAFLSNSIYNNGNLGINFGNGPTPNHLDEQGFTPPAPNNYQNYPVLSAASYTPTSSTIVGTLNSSANTTYLIQFFASPQADPSGYGEGELYLGSTSVTTGSNYDATFDATVGTGIPSGWVVSATATDPFGNTSEFSQDIGSVAIADVGVGISASPTPVVYAGQTLTYTVTVTVNGGEPATDVTLTDTLPQDILSNVTATTSVPGVTPSITGNVVTAVFGRVDPNTAPTLTITIQPTAGAVPSITDSASITTTSDDPNPSNNNASLTTTVDPAAGLALSLSGSPSASYVDGTVTYLLTATNYGPSTASDVVVTDTLPADITSNVTATTSAFGVTPTIADGVVTADLGSLAINSMATVTITVVPDAAAVPQISDSAAVTSSTYDPNGNTITPPAVTTPVEAATDLQVTVTGSPNPVPAGQAITYTITATNAGLMDDTDVMVTDTLPTGVNFVSATGGATPDQNGDVTFDLGDLGAGDSTILDVVVATTGSTPPTPTDTATITGALFDPDLTNNTAQASVTVTPVSDLAISMSGSPNPDYAGQDLTYAIQATNSGPSTDPAVDITDTLPPNVTYVSTTGGGVLADGVLTMALGSLAANSTLSVNVVVSPTAAAVTTDDGMVTNSAVISGVYDDNPDDSASTTTTVDPATGLALQVVPAPSVAQVGQDLTYTVTAVNNGPSDATGVVLTDTLPADITSDVTASTSVAGVTATVADGQVTASFGDVAFNGSVSITITVVPTLAAVTSSPLVDTASVMGDQFDPNPNTVMSSVPVAPVSDLSIAMTGSASSVGVGTGLTYTITATNSGPSTDPAPVVMDTLPADVTFDSATAGATLNNGVVEFALASLAANASTTVSLVVSPTPAAAGTRTSSITNTATISSPSNDNADNSASVETTVTAVTAVGIAISSTAAPNYAGRGLTYTITCGNAGPSNATGVVVTDTLPDGITSNLTTSTSVAGVIASVADGKVSADFGDLNVNASVTLSITVVPAQGAVTDSPIVDTATVTNNEFNSSPNTATVSTTILPVADLAITNASAAPDPVEYGNELTYTALVTNQGPSPATGVTLSTPMDAGVTFASGSWAPSAGPPGTGGAVKQVGSDLVASIGDLAVGASATLTIVVTPDRSVVGPLSATVTATGNQFNSTPSKATATWNTTVLDQPGTLQFSASSYAVDDTAGQATITVVRTAGLRGQVSVNFTTVPMTATAGLDYRPTAATVVFPAGVAQETVSVPVLDDPYDSQNVTVGLAISAPGGGAVLGSLNTAVLTIVDLNPNHNSPTVTAVQWTGTPSSITSLIVSFSEPLAPATAENPSNFAVAAVGKKGTFSTAHTTPVAVSAPVYNQGNWTVTLVPAQPLASNRFYSLLIKGTPGGVTDLGGNELAGAGAGHPGTNFTALFAQGTDLKYVDAGGNQVTFTLQHGGYLEDLLTGSGLGQRLVLVGEVPHKTVLTGRVVPGKHGSGRSYLGYSVYGLGQFGAVRVNVTSPPFVVQRYPFSPGLPLGTPPTLVRVSESPERARQGVAVVKVSAARPVADKLSTGSTDSGAVRIGVVHPKRRMAERRRG
jgi:uncharacterized repeat protein (TIGR01451 family)